MENNAIITGCLKGLLDTLDMRKHVTVFNTDLNTGKEYVIYEGAVFGLLADKELLDVYRNYDVTGLSFGIVTNILIKKDYKTQILEGCKK